MMIKIIEGAFCIACPTLKVGEATAPTCPPRLRRPCVHFCPLQPGVRGYYFWENIDILDARMCILERIQHRIGIVDEN